MKNEVSFPISYDWSKDEVVDVIHFYEAIDQAYKKGVDRDLMIGLYKRFKEIVPSKSEEKQSFKDYEEQTDQSPYHVVKKAKEASPETIIKM
ncbi:UPF0223 family protein [Bacillus shivajii]|uniref:UPF0223 family protein n=1 Tax=Bacillus shivajii TaxID=1983719 RepID=UPI001CFAED12|nr:UPF0223 family protein [Bacillus shivajii]UCZ51878.1 UPF0223 family protein [Bacillus shivajii]